MSTNGRSFDDAIAEAKTLLEEHDDAEYEALAPSAKVNYQEALEFLRRLESSIAADDGCNSSREGDHHRSETDEHDTTPKPVVPEIEIATELESTMGDDGNVVGPFGGHDVVVYDPNGGSNDWLSMDYDATVPFEDLR